MADAGEPEAIAQQLLAARQAKIEQRVLVCELLQLLASLLGAGPHDAAALPKRYAVRIILRRRTAQHARLASPWTSKA